MAIGNGSHVVFNSLERGETINGEGHRVKLSALTTWVLATAVEGKIDPEIIDECASFMADRRENKEKRSSFLVFSFSMLLIGTLVAIIVAAHFQAMSALLLGCF